MGRERNGMHGLPQRSHAGGPRHLAGGWRFRRRRRRCGKQCHCGRSKPCCCRRNDLGLFPDGSGRVRFVWVRRDGSGGGQSGARARRDYPARRGQLDTGPWRRQCHGVGPVAHEPAAPAHRRRYRARGRRSVCRLSAAHRQRDLHCLDSSQRPGLQRNGGCRPSAGVHRRVLGRGAGR
eukprot:Amastigsp_a847870_3.p3 type:complete len:178 gc:universal Amastigsp_a847870_3:915-382(-)